MVVNAEEEKLQFSKYSKNLQQKPTLDFNGVVIDNWRMAGFEGEVTVEGVLWIEDGYYLIPDAKSAKLLPHVVGPKYGYARKIEKILLSDGLDYSGLPKADLSARHEIVKQMQNRWETEFLTNLLGSDEANKLLKNKPKVVKINVIAKIKNFGTSVDCDSRGYGADIVSIRLPQDTSKRLLAKSNTPKFQVC